MSEVVEVERVGYGELTPWETIVFHEESKISLSDMQRMNAAVKAAEAAGTDVDIGDLPLERIPLALLAAAVRRHTGDDGVSLKEAGSGRYRFAADAEDEGPKEQTPEPSSSEG